MKQLVREWQEKVDALSLRERVLVFAAVVAVLAGVTNLLLLQPMLSKQKSLREQIKTDQSLISAAGDEINAKVRLASLDPDAAARARYQQLQQQIKDVQQQLQAQQKGLVAANKMNEVLHGLLRDHPRVQLLSLKTLPLKVVKNVHGETTVVADIPTAAATASAAATSVSGTASATGDAAVKNLAEKAEPKPVVQIETPLAQLAAGSKNQTAGSSAEKNREAVGGQVFRHEMELVLRGNYLDLLSCLQAMEKLPQQLYWGKASLRTDTYPQAKLSLHVYTLSLDQKWLDL